MFDLNKEQFDYLVYSFSCSAGYRIPKESVKYRLPLEQEQRSESIYLSLKRRELIQEIDSEGFCITEKGLQAVVIAMVSNNFHYDANLDQVVNNLMFVLRIATLPKKMSVEQFEEAFKALYLKKRREQELKGVVCIRTKEILYDFMLLNPSFPPKKPKNILTGSSQRVRYLR